MANTNQTATEKLDALLEGFGAEDAEAVRIAVSDVNDEAQASRDADAAGAESTVEPAVEEPKVDIAAEVARGIRDATKDIRSDVADQIDAATQVVGDSNADDADELIREIVDGVMVVVEERLDAFEADRAVIPNSVFRGRKPESQTDSDADAEIETSLSDEDFERLAKNPNLAPSMLQRALDGYQERHGQYVPFDAPRVNVAPEHLRQVQSAQVPGEAFRFDFR